ncbi:MAG: cyclic lactone autoinducer peptide [Ruminococcaceae bacterium]|nr:cyclic lactone autoinducer peptide [Oscillospiraceae bacterium]
MKTYNKKKSVMKKVVNLALKGNANSTTCVMVYQPKAPKELKKFSKMNNGK